MPRMRHPQPTNVTKQMIAPVQTGPSVESLQRAFEPCAATIHQWVRQATSDDADDPSNLTSEEPDELLQLCRNVKQRREVRDIFSKKKLRPGSHNTT